MASHFPIGSAGFNEVIKQHFTLDMINSLEDFKRQHHAHLDCTVQKLPVHEYTMDEEHGKVDKFVLYLYRCDEDNYSYEVHLDKDLKVNQVYLVL